MQFYIQPIKKNVKCHFNQPFLFVVKYLSLECNFLKFDVFIYGIYVFFCSDQIVIFCMFPLLALTCFYSSDSIPCFKSTVILKFFLFCSVTFLWVIPN